MTYIYMLQGDKRNIIKQLLQLQLNTKYDYKHQEDPYPDFHYK